MGEDSLPPAFGGRGWRPRGTTLRQELGGLWARCGVASESARLEAVLLHAPGPELAAAAADPAAALMLERLDAEAAGRQHAELVLAYLAAGVEVHTVDPPGRVPPNLMFVADLLFMTPEGAIIGRPASPVRAGEERWVARRVAEIGIPILRTVAGSATFEGADAAWLDASTVLIGRGLRTDAAGAAQVAATLAELGVRSVQVDLAPDTMHLMGDLRFLGPDLAAVRAGRFPEAGVDALRDRGYGVVDLPAEAGATTLATNFVTLEPGRILAPAGFPAVEAWCARLDIQCTTVDVAELHKAAGGIGCLTGVLRRA